VKITNAEDYLDRYRRRGEQLRPKTRNSDQVQGLRDRLWPQDNHAYRSQPAHAARAVTAPLPPQPPTKASLKRVDRQAVTYLGQLLARANGKAVKDVAGRG